MIKVLKITIMATAVATLFAACGDNCRNQNGNMGMGYDMYNNNPRCNNLNGYNGYNNNLYGGNLYGNNLYGNQYNNWNNPYGNQFGYNQINDARSQNCQREYGGNYPGERFFAVGVGASYSCVSTGGRTMGPIW